MTKRRGKGEGAVYWDDKRQRWVGAVNLGFGADGRRIRKVYRAPTKSEVLDRLDEARRLHAQGTLADRDERITVTKFLDDWLTTVVPERVRASTADGYRYQVDRYIVPHLGRKHLARLTVADVDRWQATLRDEGLSPRTRQYARAVLRAALKVAEARGLVARNVAALSTPPKMASGEQLDRFTLDEASALLRAAETHPLGCMVTVPLLCGLRKSEMLALRWQDVTLDCDVPFLRVTGSLTRITGQGLVRDEAKTSKRRGQAVPLPDLAAAALRARRKVQAEERLAAGPHWHDLDYVLTTPVGTPLDPRNAGREWRDICTTAGVRYRPQRLLRHSAAVLLLSAGVPLHAVSETLGHTDVNITKQVYAGHLEPEQRLAAEAMNTMLARRERS